MRKIGSLREHMIRTVKIAILLAEKAGLSVDETIDLARAAAIYKFDLLQVWLVNLTSSKELWVRICPSCW